jgi:hypothetical protein
MNTIATKYQLLVNNTCPGKDSGDIKEHLPTLYQYATECNSVFESGVRGCISSWAFLYGLLNGNEGNKTLFLNDIVYCDTAELFQASKPFPEIIVKCKWQNNLTLEFQMNYDLTFIDTWHVYGQLKRELEKFSKITNKYIILHDTTVDGIFGETIRMGMNALKQSKESGFPLDEINRGLWPAVTEFLETHDDWVLKERFENNNGLTILAKIEK